MNEYLIVKAKHGDSDAFCRLMDIHMQNMYKVAWSYLKNDEDVADVIQDTILSGFENLQKLKKNHFFKTWLMRILINNCNDILKKRKKTVSMEDVSEPSAYIQEYDKIEWLQVLSPLDEKYRIVLLLYYIESYNTREISEILDMKESTVKSRLQRGRAQLLQEYSYEIKEEHA